MPDTSHCKLFRTIYRDWVRDLMSCVMQPFQQPTPGAAIVLLCTTLRCATVFTHIAEWKILLFFSFFFFFLKKSIYIGHRTSFQPSLLFFQSHCLQRLTAETTLDIIPFSRHYGDRRGNRRGLHWDQPGRFQSCYWQRLCWRYSIWFKDTVSILSFRHMSAILMTF